MKSRSPRARVGRAFSDKVCFAFLIIALCCVLYPAQTFSQIQSDICEVEAEGVGVIISGDIARARDNAIRESLKKGIERAVSGFLSPEMVAENFQIINTRIYSKSRDYVQNYKITGESADEEYYRVRVRAVITEEGLRKDLESLGFLVARENLPRIMVIIYEHNNEIQGSEYEPKPEGPSSSVYIIGKKFSEEGFILVEYPRGEYGGENLNEDDAVSLGRSFNADLVIVGEASVIQKSGIEGTEMKSYEATVSAKVMRTDDTTMVASVTAEAESLNVDSVTGRADAIDKAAREAADYLKERIVADWQREVSSITVVSVTIQDIRSYSDYVKVRDTLKNETRGVKKLFQKKMKSGIAMLDVEIEGNARFLANELSASKFDEFSLGIVCTNENSLEVSIIK